MSDALKTIRTGALVVGLLAVPFGAAMGGLNTGTDPEPYKPSLGNRLKDAFTPEWREERYKQDQQREYRQRMREMREQQNRPVSRGPAPA